MLKRLIPFGFTPAQIHSFAYDDPPPAHTLVNGPPIMPSQPPPTPPGMGPVPEFRRWWPSSPPTGSPLTPPPPGMFTPSKPPPPPPPPVAIVKPRTESRLANQGAGSRRFADINVPIDPSLKVSPFLSWAKDKSGKPQSVSNEESSAQTPAHELRTLKMTLNALTKRLSKNTLSTLSNYNAFSKQYSKGKLYEAVPEKDSKDVGSMEISILLGKWEVVPATAQDADAIATYHRYVSWSMTLMLRHLSDIFAATKELMECFVGTFSDAPIIKKLNGALYLLMTVRIWTSEIDRLN